jgi:hypothetical protein
MLIFGAALDSRMESVSLLLRAGMRSSPKERSQRPPSQGKTSGVVEVAKAQEFQTDAA